MPTNSKPTTPPKAPAKRDRRQPAPGYQPVKLFDAVWLLVMPFYDADTGALHRIEYVSQDEGADPDAPRTWRRRADAVRDSHTDYARRQNEILTRELQKLRAQLGANSVAQPVSQNMLSAVS